MQTRRRGVWAAICLLIALSPDSAPAEVSVRCDAGATFEDYSFAPWGTTQRAQCVVYPVERWGLLGAESVVTRFGLTDVQGTLGFVAKISRTTALEVHANIAPGANVVPIFSTDWLVYHGIRWGITLTPTYRYSHYAITDVHMLSLGGDWQWNPQFNFILRTYGTLTQFEGGSESRLTPGVLIGTRITLIPSVQFYPSYSYREESFEAGAPGRLESGTFKAHLGRLEMNFKAGKAFTFRIAWQYEGRLPSNYVRQFDIGVTTRF